MRITLLHNPKAGKGEHEGEDLVARLTKAGHEVRYRSTKDEGLENALARKTDLVLVAGGDGTVGKVARGWRARDAFQRPAAGDGENLARSLGFNGSTKKLITQLDEGRAAEVRCGLRARAVGQAPFFRRRRSGAPAGLPRWFQGRGGKRCSLGVRFRAGRRSRSHVDLLRRLLASYEARDWELMVDGEDLSGRYLYDRSAQHPLCRPDPDFGPGSADG